MPSHCDPISWSSSWRQEGLHCRGMPKAEENSSSYVKKDVLLLPWRGSQITSWGWWLVLRPWCLTSKQDQRTLSRPLSMRHPLKACNAMFGKKANPISSGFGAAITVQYVCHLSQTSSAGRGRWLPATTSWLAVLITNYCSFPETIFDPTEMEDLWAINGTPIDHAGVISSGET